MAFAMIFHIKKLFMEYGQKLKNPNRLDCDIFITPPQLPALGDISGDDEIPDLYEWISYDPNNPFVRLNNIDRELNQTDDNHKSHIIGNIYCQRSPQGMNIIFRDRLKKKLEEKRHANYLKDTKISADELGVPIDLKRQYLEKDIENIFSCWKDN